MSERTYNAQGLIRLCTAAAEFVPMIVNGNEDEVQKAVKKIYDTARCEFPSGPREVRDALNGLCTELDLPLIVTARNKDTGEIA